MEPLIEIPRDSWTQLRDLYTHNWPEGAVAYCMLDSFLKHPSFIEDFNFKVYSPNGNIDYGLIATSLRDNYYQVIIQPIGENTTKFEEALLNTKIIDWDKGIMVPSASDKAIECLEKVKDALGLIVHYDENSKAYKHLLSKDTQKFEITLPPNTFIGPLTPSHIDLIDKTWTYHSDNTRSFFEILMKNNLTYVLYSTETKAPLAWVTADNNGGLTHLYCLEEHRRKGYGEIVTKCAVNDFLSKEQHVIAYTLEENMNPKNLFIKMGFQNIGYNHWTFVKKIKVPM